MYILRSADNAVYIGVTETLDERYSITPLLRIPLPGLPRRGVSIYTSLRSGSGRLRLGNPMKQIGERAQVRQTDGLAVARFRIQDSKICERSVFLDSTSLTTASVAKLFFGFDTRVDFRCVISCLAAG